MRPLLGVMLLASAACAGAFESRDARGLDVHVEPLPGPVAVDGVMLEIKLASGRDVAELARRVEQRWRQQGSLVQRLQQHGWQLLTRWEAGHSELIQWRGEGEPAQLIFSRLDTLRPSARAGRGPLVLPARCAWRRQIEDRSHTLRSASCRLTLAELQRQLRAALAAQGWSVRRETGAIIEIARDGESGRVTLVAGTQPGESAVVWSSVAAMLPVHDQ